MTSLRQKTGTSTAVERHPTAVDPRRELLARILASSAFVKSERLSSLLVHICDLTFTAREKDLNEQKIGEAVFDRPVNYDSAIDGIVRTQASRLRKRLDLYFDGEGAHEPIRIVIPRGGYVPLFEPRIDALAAHVAPSYDPIAAPAPKNQVPAAAAARPSHSATFAWSLVALLGF